MSWLKQNNPAAGIYSWDYFHTVIIGHPFVCIWAFSVLIWFALELDTWAAHNFNSKHSYGLYAKRVLLSLSCFVTLLKTTKSKKAFLKSVYKFYI